eukprot:TRINITY_DN1209_c0_g1_i1.p1 TRINITY_DN1209_c0_g1~~TRINITY_DN1209_c0_g1_i1.p1  ORF type:complete len:628 (+),score=185.71 TRINITY_DN1209_c0_g1_i1:241-1884(+)
MTLPNVTSFLDLEDQIKNLFRDQQLFTTHSIKYKDDEGDWVTMSSDLELKEATRLIDNKRLIQLSIEPKNAAVQQVSDALHQLQKDPQLLQSLIQSLSNSRISSPSTPPSYSSSSTDYSLVSPPQQPFPFKSSTSQLDSNANLNNSSAQQQKDFAPVVLPQSQSNELASQVWCDGCGVKLLHQSYKCTECPDYDLCDICYPKRAVSKVHHHDNFYHRGLDWGKVVETKPQGTVSVQPTVTSPQAPQQQVQPVASPFQPEHKNEDQMNITPSVVPPVQNTVSSPYQPSTFSPPQIQQQQPTPTIQPNATVFNSPEPKNTFRHSARCDSCMKQIIGIRHKCQGCDDYDLCDNCYPIRTHNNSHQFETIIGREESSPAPNVALFQSPIAAPPSELSIYGTLPSVDSLSNYSRFTNYSQLPLASSPGTNSGPISSNLPVSSDATSEAVLYGTLPPLKNESNSGSAPSVNQGTPESARTSVHGDTNVPQQVEFKQIGNPSSPSPSPIGLDRKTIEDGLKQLHDMGFHDKSQNLRALVSSNGNVVAAITSLLN